VSCIAPDLLPPRPAPLTTEPMGNPAPGSTVVVRECTHLYNSTMTAVSVSEARATLPDIVDRVQAGEEITLTRHGVPVAVLVNPSALRTRRTTTAFQLATELGRVLDEARRQPLASTTSVDTATAERWVSELYEARKGH
jgi:prevent-host-death family protein